MDLQVMLLRVIEEKCIIRLGGNKLIPVNVRIIAATNKNLEEEIARKSFRLDLFYRLGVIRLNMPPLRKRPDDIPLLVGYFTKNICQRYNKSLKTFSPEAEKALQGYHWPGNVRELQNILEGAIQLTNSEEITYNDIKNYLNYFKAENSNDTDIINNSVEPTLYDIEKQMIEKYLKEGKLTKNELAKTLGISRRTLYRRIEKYKLL
jgi:transcriptional regulator with PAS, ATPase and Fis domain